MQPIDRLFGRIARNGQAIAVADHAGSELTYAGLGSRISALATGLQALDSTAGSRVGICAWNTIDHLIALLATYAAGKVWVPLNPRNARGDLDAMIAATGPSVIIAGEDCMGGFSRPASHLVIAGERASGAITVAGLITDHEGRHPARVERDAEDAQIIKFSGGSTGTPKPVVQSLRCVNAQADGIRDFFEFRDDDVNLVAAPLTHGASCFVLPILERGGRHVLLPEAKASAVLDAIARHRVTTMYAPPTLLYSVMESPDAAHADMSSLRHVIYSAAPMPARRIRDCQRVFGPVIETAYGQVEAPQIIAAMRADELLVEENLTSVGRPTAVATVGIMSDSGMLVAAGEVGEIVVSGPLLMSGYLGRPEETDRALVDGWLHTGDLGVLDERGYLFIRGRIREVINSGGFKIFPGDVEASLVRHSAVAECAVFGVDDARWGEAVHAAVVLEPGALVADDELIGWVKAELGSVKAPKRVWRVASLERNAAGKVSRGAVRASVFPNSHG